MIIGFIKEILNKPNKTKKEDMLNPDKVSITVYNLSGEEQGE